MLTPEQARLLYCAGVVATRETCSRWEIRASGRAMEDGGRRGEQVKLEQRLTTGGDRWTSGGRIAGPCSLVWECLDAGLLTGGGAGLGLLADEVKDMSQPRCVKRKCIVC